jgi:hypothetical protein
MYHLYENHYTSKFFSFIADVIGTSDKHSFPIISANFRKNSKQSQWDTQWPRGTLIKNMKLKISCQTFFKLYLSLFEDAVRVTQVALCTVKKAVELLDAPSKNTFLKLNKYNSIVEIVYLDTHVFFPHSVIE